MFCFVLFVCLFVCGFFCLFVCLFVCLFFYTIGIPERFSFGFSISYNLDWPRPSYREQFKEGDEKETGLEWNTILRKAENHEEWRKLVVKSTVVPQRSGRLRDR